jgi:hypothetical protein
VNIKKKLTVFGAFALPFAGLAAFGGAQAASAAAPALTCQAVAPASGVTGGETWTNNSNGSDPGSAGVYFDSSAGGGMELAASAIAGATSLSLTDPKGSTALATTDQVLTITGVTGTYTVTSDSFLATPPHVPDTVTITPALPVAVKSKTLVTVAPTVTASYRVVDDATFSDSTTLTSATADFTSGDVGSPIAGEIGATHGTGGQAITSNTGTTLTIVGFTNSTTVTLSSEAYKDSGGSSPTYTAASGTGTVTIGETTVAPANIYPDLNLAASECGMSANTPGEFAPNTASMVGVGQATVQNTALALEAAPPATNFNITYPSIGSGWTDDGGYPDTNNVPATALAFPGGKDNEFVLNSPGGSGACTSITANCDSFLKGTATGDWPTTKGQLGLAANGLVFCTLAESQAIAGTPNSGGPDNTANGGHIATGANPSAVCDGGSSNLSGDNSESQALGVIITLELNPSANAYGSDNTSPTSIWNVDAGNASNTVF